MKSKLKIAFYVGTGNFTDWSIRTWTRGEISHVELLYETEDTLFGHDHQVNMVSSSARDGGVRTKYDVTLNPENWLIYDLLTDKTLANLREFADAHDHCGYDYPGILFSEFLPLGFHSSLHFYCSEFVATFLGLERKRISPRKLHDTLWRMGLIRSQVHATVDHLKTELAQIKQTLWQLSGGVYDINQRSKSCAKNGSNSTITTSV